MEKTIFKLQLNIFASGTVHMNPYYLIDLVLAIGVFREAKHIDDRLLFGLADQINDILSIYTFFCVVVNYFFAEPTQEEVAGDTLECSDRKLIIAVLEEVHVMDIVLAVHELNGDHQRSIGISSDSLGHLFGILARDD